MIPPPIGLFAFWELKCGIMHGLKGMSYNVILFPLIHLPPFSSEDECEPPEPFEQPDHVEYPENPTASVAEDTNVEEVPMDICIQERFVFSSGSMRPPQ